jgi:hypothetical protein
MTQDQIDEIVAAAGCGPCFGAHEAARQVARKNGVTVSFTIS